MSNVSWSAPVSADEAARRAAGRRHYNARRREEMLWRRQEVLYLLRERGLYHGVQADIARRLGVSRATISRDVAALLYRNAWCPTCAAIHGHSWWEERVEEGRARWTDDDRIAAVT